MNTISRSKWSVFKNDVMLAINFITAGIQIIFNPKESRRCCTTGNAFFTESLRLCRGRNLGHSAKTLFAEGQPQRPSAKSGPRQRVFTEGYALDKDKPSAKIVFAKGRGPRQIWSVGSRRTRSVRLCRGPAVRPSAKFVFFLPLCEGYVLGPRQRPPLPRGEARPSAKFFIFFVF